MDSAKYLLEMINLEELNKFGDFYFWKTNEQFSVEMFQCADGGIPETALKIFVSNQKGLVQDLYGDA